MTIEGQFAPFQRLEFEDIDRRFPGGGAVPPPAGNDAWLWQGTDHILWDHTDKMMISLSGAVPGAAYAAAPGLYTVRSAGRQYIAVPGVYLVVPPTLIDPASGTNIGDMTSQGGLAAAFDGVYLQGGGVSAVSFIGDSSGGYVGKTFAGPTALHHAVAYPSSDNGFAITYGALTTITLYGKQGSPPSNKTDGTVLGTSAFISDTTTPRAVVSSDIKTLWDHGWVLIQYIDSWAICAELEFWKA